MDLKINNNNPQPRKQPTVEEQLWSANILKKIGLIIIGIALLLIVVTVFLNSRATITLGTVVSVATNKPNGGKRATPSIETYKPFFTFVDGKGATHKAPYYTYESGLNFKDGEQVKIGYDPDDFSSVRIVSWRENFILPFYIGLFGAFIVWLSTVSKKQTLKEINGEQNDDKTHKTKQHHHRI